MSHSPRTAASRSELLTRQERDILNMVELLRQGLKPQPLASLEDLNNDVLLIVVELLFEADPPSRSHPHRSHPSTLAFSLTSRRLRALCIPLLFRDVYRLTPTMGQLNHRLRDLEGNPLLSSTPAILPYVR